MQSKTATNLILVAGHAAFKSTIDSCPEDPGQDDWWILNPQFQLGEPPFYVEHIRHGLNLLSSSLDSILVFSGGLTRPDTHWTEAETYLTIAQSMKSSFPDLDWSRVAKEEFARDSLEN